MAAREAFVVSLADLWVVKVSGRQVGGGHGTQAEAVETARTWLRNTGGGDLVVLAENGDLRRKDRIFPSNDPRNRPA
jgi:hypothetical protein